MTSIFNWFRRTPKPEDFFWHERELHYPVTLIDGGIAMHVAWRRWNGNQWEYREHPEENQRWIGDQW